MTNWRIPPDGQSINILGDNGTGKTTLYDAFPVATLWKKQRKPSDI